MGEIADSMINGECCSYCGMYFLDKAQPDQVYQHGHPAICKDCWNGMSGKERADARKAGLQRALVETI